MNLVRAPAVSDVIQDNLNDLDVGVINPSPPLSVTVHVARCVNGAHGCISFADKMPLASGKCKPDAPEHWSSLYPWATFCRIIP